ncbi:hypothetical protein Trydic_g3958 [Trypoxylus dichotomus]
MMDKGYNVLSHKDEALVVGKDGITKLMANGVCEFYFVCEYESNEQNFTFASRSSGALDVYHRRLGHINLKDLLEANQKRNICGMDIKLPTKEIHYEVCLEGEMTWTPFPKRFERTSELLELIHIDVHGLMRVELNGMAKYFVEFIDGHCRWCEVRFIKHTT